MKWFHRHRWVATGVTHLYTVHRLHPEHRCPVTEVLRVCDCGEVQTICLEGSWELEQLQPKAGPVTDDEFFRKLGVKL